MRRPEKASDLGGFAFPRNTKPRRYDYGGTATFPFGGLRTTGATGGFTVLRRGDPGLRVGGGSGLRGRVAALRRPSEKDPAVGKLPLPFGGVGCGRGLSGRSLRT